VLIAAARAARGGGPRVMGCYHSHPSGIAAPSSTDAAMAAHDGKLWAIVAGGAIGWWLDDVAGFQALPSPAQRG
jgi:proteasome lid subunit RPN8/RPN11